MNSVNRLARTAGFLYLLLLPLGVFGMLYVPSTLIVAGDAAATIRNIAESETLFRLSIVATLLVQVVNIFVVVALYQLLKPVNQRMAVMMVIFILIGAPIAMLNEINHVALLLAVQGVDQVQALIPLFHDLHEYGVNIAGIFWGLWLFPMGYLVFKSRFLPRIIGIMLMIGCVGYVVDSLIFFLLPDFGIMFTQFTFIGEIVLPLWLLIKGVNVEQWQNQAWNVPDLPRSVGFSEVATGKA